MSDDSKSLVSVRYTVDERHHHLCAKNFVTPEHFVQATQSLTKASWLASVHLHFSLNTVDSYYKHPRESLTSSPSELPFSFDLSSDKLGLLLIRFLLGRIPHKISCRTCRTLFTRPARLSAYPTLNTPLPLMKLLQFYVYAWFMKIPPFTIYFQFCNGAWIVIAAKESKYVRKTKIFTIKLWSLCFRLGYILPSSILLLGRYYCWNVTSVAYLVYVKWWKVGVSPFKWSTVFDTDWF